MPGIAFGAHHRYQVCVHAHHHLREHVLVLTRGTRTVIARLTRTGLDCATLQGGCWPGRCSICCHNVAVRHNPTEADIRKYFWSLVDKNGPVPDPATGVKSKCWLWLGSVTDQGYGRFKAGGEMYMARRFAWLEMGKPDPGALTVSTRCSNKALWPPPGHKDPGRDHGLSITPVGVR
jgi:hypothetical protein